MQNAIFPHKFGRLFLEAKFSLTKKLWLMHDIIMVKKMYVSHKKIDRSTTLIIESWYKRIISLRKFGRLHICVGITYHRESDLTSSKIIRPLSENKIYKFSILSEKFSEYHLKEKEWSLLAERLDRACEEVFYRVHRILWSRSISYIRDVENGKYSWNSAISDVV